MKGRPLLDERLLRLEALGEQVDLQMERPALHVGVEGLEERVLGDRLVVDVPAECARPGALAKADLPTPMLPQIPTKKVAAWA